VKTYSLTIKNPLAAAGVAVGLVGVGVLIVFVGFALLAALAVTGAVLGTGMAVYHRLRGGRAELPRARAIGLDPALEVRPRTQSLPALTDHTDAEDELPPAE
jgi:hypothetical protein